MPRTRGLVLGGGGITGIAWELGLVTGLAAAGVDLRAAEVVVGTSAGSVVGAQLRSQVPLPELYDAQLAPPDPGRPARIGRRVTLGFALAALRSRSDTEAMGRALGSLALKAARAGRTPTLEERYAAIRERLPELEWPERRLVVTAVNARTGTLRTFDGSDGVPLLDAVAASCAVPGVYPPVPVGGVPHIDGGARSGANADLVTGRGRVLALTPVDRAIGPLRSAAQQLADVEHLVLSPDGAALEAIGANVLDPAARAASARAGLAQAEAVADRVRDFWCD